MAHGAARHAGVPEGLVWGVWFGLHPNADHADQNDFNAIASTLASVHHKTNRWDQGVLAASGGRVTDAQATAIQTKLPVQHIMFGDFPGESVFSQILKTLGMSAVPTPGFVVAAGATTEAMAGGAAAGAGADAAAGGAAGGAGAGAGAAGAAAAGGLSSELISGGLLAALAAAVSGYGVRLLEIVAGAVLVLFGLATLAKGRAPNVARPAAAAVLA
jgi:hypothetical protein